MHGKGLAAAGSRVTLTAEVLLPPDVHVYAPGSRDYKPIELVIDPQPEIEFCGSPKLEPGPETRRFLVE